MSTTKLPIQAAFLALAGQQERGKMRTMPDARHDTPALPYPRSFIALGPDAPTRARLAQAGASLPPARLHAADLHLTIAFLGALTEQQATQLHAALRPLARRLPDLDEQGWALWPGTARPRVAVATFGLPAQLRELVQATQDTLRTMGLPVEDRPYRPHVTLARLGQGRPAPRVLPQPSAPVPAARFDTLGLYCTAAPNAGVRYRALFQLPLA